MKNKSPYSYEAPILARVIAPKLRVNPKLDSAAIKQELFRYVTAVVTDKFAQKVKAEAYKLIHGTVADATAKLASYAQLLNAQGHFCKIEWVTKDEAVNAIRRALEQRKERHEEEQATKPPQDRREWTYPEPDLSGMQSTDR